MKQQVLLFVLVAIIGGVPACDKSPTPYEFDGRFAIYVTKENFYGKQIVLDEVELVEEPLLTLADIDTYSWENHTITYSEAVYERMKAWGDLYGRGFVVTVDGERIYGGVFLSMISSWGCQNPVIMLSPQHPGGQITFPPSLWIARAYPSYWGSNQDPDIRADVRIHDALDEAGVLIP